MLEGVGERDVAVETKAQPPVGQPLTQRSGERGQHHVGAVLGGTDQQDPLLGRTEVGQGRVVCGEDAPGVAEHPMPQLGEGDTAAGAFDDGTADHCLDAPHVLADGGLSHVQHRGGAVKPATVRHRNQAAQRRDIEHLTHAANVLRSAHTIKTLP